MKWIAAIGLIIALQTCQNQDKTPAPAKTLTPAKISIIIGICCAECGGNCFQGYMISDSAVFSLTGRYCDDIDMESQRAMSAEKADSVKALLALLPPDWKNYGERIGCPDCTDQCSVLVQSIQNGKVKKLVIDPIAGKHPVNMDLFIQKITAHKLL